MPGEKQRIGDLGEKFVAKRMSCLRCKRAGTLKQLPTNFKCVDLICDFCGATSQVKTFQKEAPGLPSSVLGAAWRPQEERMASGIYHPLWLVRLGKSQRVEEVWLIPSELQKPDLFVKRKPLSPAAKKAGWQGYNIDTKGFADNITKML